MAKTVLCVNPASRQIWEIDTPNKMRYLLRDKDVMSEERDMDDMRIFILITYN